MIGRALLALALVFGLTAAAHAAETPIPAAPTRWVTDQAGLLSPATVSQLDDTLASYQRSSGHQVIVWIGTTLGGAPIEEWSAKAFSKWGIGSRGKDDGVAIFVFATDHQMRIEVGYGLEDVLPDAFAARIVHDVMAPELRAGHADAALEQGVANVLSRLGAPEFAGSAAPQLRAQHAGGGGAPVGIIVLVVLVGGFLFYSFRYNPIALWVILDILSSIMRGGGGGFGGGGFGGGGGGFSGGGGRSGGGGASGSW